MSKNANRCRYAIMPKKITKADIELVWHTYEALQGVPVLTEAEVIRGVPKLLRAGGMTFTKAFAIKFVTGRNNTRAISPGRLNVNLAQGWRPIVRMCAWRATSNSSIHHTGLINPTIEIKLARVVCSRDWLVGALKPKPKEKVTPSKAEIRNTKIAALEARLLGWMKKQARADTAIHKINRSLNALRRYQNGNEDQ